MQELANHLSLSDNAKGSMKPEKPLTMFFAKKPKSTNSTSHASVSTVYH